MKSKKALIDYCLSLPGAYEDHPFAEDDWTVMRRAETTRGFAWIFHRGGKLWVNVKLPPDLALDIRASYSSALPGYHMNKTHWTSLILDGSIPDALVKDLVAESYALCGAKAGKAKKAKKAKKGEEGPPD